MKTFIMLTKPINKDDYSVLATLIENEEVVQKIKKHYSNVRWLSNYAVLGSWNYISIFCTKDITTAMEVSALVQSYTGVYTELWPAVDSESLMKDITVDNNTALLQQKM